MSLDSLVVFFIEHDPQSSPIKQFQIQLKVQVLKFYNKYLEKKFSDLPIEALTSRIIKIAEPLLTKIQSHLSLIEVDPFIFISNTDNT